MILTIGLFGIYACQNTKQSSDNLSEKDSLSDKDSIGNEDSFHRDDHPIDTDTTTILFKTSFAHEFSDNAQKDSFNIYITGKTIHYGLVRFNIKNATGQIIYSESFPTSNIWDVEMHNSPKEETEKYILNFINKYFNEKNFFSPAIGQGESFMDDYSDKKIWDELKGDKSAIGFSCSSGYEDGRKIAYLKSLKRAVIYFECC